MHVYVIVHILYLYDEDDEYLYKSRWQLVEMVGQLGDIEERKGMKGNISNFCKHQRFKRKGEDKMIATHPSQGGQTMLSCYLRILGLSFCAAHMCRAVMPSDAICNRNDNK